MQEESRCDCFRSELQRRGGGEEKSCWSWVCCCTGWASASLGIAFMVFSKVEHIDTNHASIDTNAGIGIGLILDLILSSKFSTLNPFIKKGDTSVQTTLFSCSQTSTLIQSTCRLRTQRQIYNIYSNIFSPLNWKWKNISQRWTMKNVWTLLCWRLNVLIIAYNTFKKQKLHLRDRSWKIWKM